ncbi:unnamed protein product, partial [Ectocarpus sp. 12 AP-2014]
GKEEAALALGGGQGGAEVVVAGGDADGTVVRRYTEVDFTNGELPSGATMFEAVQMLMLKHARETAGGEVPITSSGDRFPHRSMPMPREQWGKTITLEFSPRSCSSHSAKPPPASSAASASPGGAAGRAAGTAPPASASGGPAGSGAAASSSSGSGDSAAAAGSLPPAEVSSSSSAHAGPPSAVGSASDSSSRRVGGGCGGSRRDRQGKDKKEKPLEVLELPGVLAPGATPLDAR